MIILKHMITLNNIYIRTADDVRAIFYAPIKSGGTDIPWIIIDGAPPIPVATPIEELLEMVNMTTIKEIK